MSDIKSYLDEVEVSIKDKKEYSYFLIHKVRYQNIFERINKLSLGKKLTILDIGCYPYHVGLILEKMGHTVYGIASIHEPVKHSKVFVCNIEKEKFPFKDNFFDMVLCNEVIEHLIQSPLPPLLEMYRVLKPNGLLMVTTPNIVRSINRVKLLLGKSIMFPIDVYFENNKKGNIIYHRHNREYILDELVTVIFDAGFLIENKGYFISYTPFRKKVTKDSLVMKMGKIGNFLLISLFPKLQDTLFVIAKKS